MANSLQTIPEIIVDWANSAPSKFAIYSIDRQPLQYGGLVEQAEHVQNTLCAAHIQPRDHVALIIEDKAGLSLCFVGCLFHGATSVPVNPNGTLEEIRSYLVEAKVCAVMTDGKPDSSAVRAAQMLGLSLIRLTTESDRIAVHFDDVPDTVSLPQTWRPPSDIAYLVSTSGTTGRKIVPRTHQEIIWNFQRKNQTVIANGERDICLNPMPLFFNHGFHGGLLAALLGGGGIILCSSGNVREFFDCLDQFEPTWMLAGKTYIQAVLSAAPAHEAIIRKSALAFVHSGGAAFERDLVSNFETLFATRLVECYAMSEVSTIACPPMPPTEMKPGTAGMPVTAEIDIVDESGVPVEDGSVGEIVVRDPGVMKGYFNNPTADAEAFQDDWFRTGDLGSLDRDGFLTLAGRLKDIISRGGEKISPLEIEHAILEHPSVDQVCVFGIAHPTLTEVPGAAIVTSSGANLSQGEIAGFLRSLLSPSKIPVAWIFLDTLPTSAAGKTRRDELAELYRQKQVA